MTILNNVTRQRAAGVHLLISFLIGTGTLALMLFLWFPMPLFYGMGGSELAILIIGVDIAIGPLITLIVFNPQKKPARELLMDLTIIAVFQLSALTYGMYAISQGRPVFTVFTGDRFAVVSAAELEAKDLVAGNSEEFNSLSWTGPRLVAAEEPTDPQARSDLAFAEAFGGGIQYLPKYYVPYRDKRTAVLSATHPLDDLDLQANERATIESYLHSTQRTWAQPKCLPVSTKLKLMTALIDGDSGDLLKIFDIPPNLKKH